jgi:hypothetical protein
MHTRGSMFDSLGVGMTIQVKKPITSKTWVQYLFHLTQFPSIELWNLDLSFVNTA